MTQRFHIFLEGNDILHKSQFGYRKGLGTIGPTVILRNIAKETLGVRKKKLYACFVDYRKAFDGGTKEHSTEEIEIYGNSKQGFTSCNASALQYKFQKNFRTIIFLSYLVLKGSNIIFNPFYTLYHPYSLNI